MRERDEGALIQARLEVSREFDSKERAILHDRSVGAGAIQLEIGKHSEAATEAFDWALGLKDAIGRSIALAAPVAVLSSADQS